MFDVNADTARRVTVKGDDPHVLQFTLSRARVTICWTGGRGGRYGEEGGKESEKAADGEGYFSQTRPVGFGPVYFQSHRKVHKKFNQINIKQYDTDAASTEGEVAAVSPQYLDHDDDYHHQQQPKQNKNKKKRGGGGGRTTENFNMKYKQRLTVQLPAAH